MDKSPDAFRTISEVAADLDLPQHVLRFWETRFVQIKPLKRGGGRRYYRPDDVELLKGIRHLLYGEGYTIRGVQRILKEQGVRFVMNVWLEGAPQPPASAARFDEPAVDPAFEEEVDEEPAELPPDDAYSPYAPHHLAPPPMRAEEPSDFAAPAVRPADPRSAAAPPPRLETARAEPRFESARAESPLEAPRFEAPRVEDDAEGFAAMAQRFAPRFVPVAEPEPIEDLPAPPRLAPTLSRATPRPLGDVRPSPVDEVAPVVNRSSDDDGTPDLGGLRPSRLPSGLRPPEPPEPPRSGLGHLFDRLRPGVGREAEAAAPRTVQTLSRDEIRRLQSTLFELLECKRLLDQVR